MPRASRRRYRLRPETTGARSSALTPRPPFLRAPKKARPCRPSQAGASNQTVKPSHCPVVSSTRRGDSKAGIASRQPHFDCTPTKLNRLARDTNSAQTPSYWGNRAADIGPARGTGQDISQSTHRLGKSNCPFPKSAQSPTLTLLPDSGTLRPPSQEDGAPAWIADVSSRCHGGCDGASGECSG